jgi:hypothetical protein
LKISKEVIKGVFVQVTVLLIFLAIFIATMVPIIGANVIFLILGLLMVILIIWRNKELKKTIHKVPPNQPSMVNMDVGGVFELTGVGKDAEGMTLKVLRKHLYQEGDYYWHELECDRGDGEKIWVEVEDDDETVVSVVLDKFKLNGLGGASVSSLKKMDDDETGTISYNGDTYAYYESDAAIFYRDCDSKNPEKLYYWDFKPLNKARDNYLIGVERWGDEATGKYDVFYCQIMRPGQIKVFSNKGEN